MHSAAMNVSSANPLSELANSWTNLSPEQRMIAYTAIAAYIQKKIISYSIGLLVTYSVLATLCAALVVYLRFHRGGARRGDSDAARKMLLPAFEPLLWILGVTASVYCIYLVAAFSLAFYPTKMPSVHIECFYAGRQFVLLLVAVFMLQMSVTIPALVRTVAITLVLSTYTLPVAWYMETHSAIGDTDRADLYYYLQVGSHALVQPLFVYVMVRPPSRASKTALRYYCAFALVQYCIEAAYLTAFWHREIDLGFHLAFTNLAVGSLCPLFVWGVLKADTEHWRGLGQRACALQALFRQRANVHEHLSSEGLHVLIEMHRKFVIDFAHLELRERIGVGASAVVYTGVLRSKTPVAVKVYTPTTVTEDTVAAFSHEAALCGALHHPNVVRFYGMCVSPPTICLVSELCQGSLDVVTLALARRRRDGVQQHSHHHIQQQGHQGQLGQQRHQGQDCDPAREHQQLLLVNLGYMLDAARAVAYIHSFSPAFVHRDIKPANFLVDARGTVKLTDFGESRFLPKLSASAKANVRTAKDSTSVSDSALDNVLGSGDDDDAGFTSTDTSTDSGIGGGSIGANTGIGIGINIGIGIGMGIGSRGSRGSSKQTQSPTALQSPPYVSYEVAKRDGARAASVAMGQMYGGRLPLPSAAGATTTTTTIAGAKAPTSQMTVKGTVDYMAPEMIQGKAGLARYDEAADVYSLAVTMWDVLNPAKDKYPRARDNHLRVFESVVAGDRPELDAALHPALRDLLARGWHEDHRRRPTARAVVQALERIQEDVAATLACELQGALGGGTVVSEVEATHAQCIDSDLGVAGGSSVAVAAGGAAPSESGNVARSRSDRASIAETRSAACLNMNDSGVAATTSSSNSSRARTSTKPSRAVQSTARTTVSGDALVRQLVDLRAVAAVSEAMRLGSMLMDAGLLHHIKHACAFECSRDALYFFDDDRIRRCQSIAMLESSEQQQQQEKKEATATHRAFAHGDSSAWLGPSPRHSHSHSHSHSHRAARAARRHTNSLASEYLEASTAESSLGAFLGRSAHSNSDEDSSAAADSYVCACRQLGQRFVRQERSVKRLFRRKHTHAHAPIPEHSVLTANLLSGSQHFGYHVSLSDSESGDSEDGEMISVDIGVGIETELGAKSEGGRESDGRLSFDASVDSSRQQRVLV